MSELPQLTVIRLPTPLNASRALRKAQIWPWL
jgi:hypothetical protein